MANARTHKDWAEAHLRDPNAARGDAIVHALLAVEDRLDALITVLNPVAPTSPARLPVDAS